jgi:hypothetical protein
MLARGLKPSPTGEPTMPNNSDELNTALAKNMADILDQGVDDNRHLADFQMGLAEKLLGLNRPEKPTQENDRTEPR